MSPPLQFQDTRMSHPSGYHGPAPGRRYHMHCTQAFPLSWRLRRGTISDLRGRLFGTIPVKLYGRWGNLSKKPVKVPQETEYFKKQTSFGDNRLTPNFLYIYLVAINRVLYFAFSFFVFALLAYQFEPPRPLYFGLFGLCRGSDTQIK